METRSVQGIGNLQRCWESLLSTKQHIITPVAEMTCGLVQGASLQKAVWNDPISQPSDCGVWATSFACVAGLPQLRGR